MKSCAVLLCLVLCIALFSVTQSQELREYAGDCSKYLHCRAGGCHIMSCGKGTEFNPSIGTCDYPLMNRQGCHNRG
ncbi:uncharacterized protein LOC105832040 [Monomorium pharaonis]|uniref:uncharacterized protein LOC105832040 n=1 Tax=Monomorium pharaonis TaxID=307658 RepID=UPI00063ED7BE|nr:uncharacterized protein LOC105832040 [Monomorium pharaonis]